MLGTYINTLAIVAGSLLGLLLRKGVPERFRRTVIDALGLAVILIGIKSSLKSDALLIIIVSLVIGSLIGEMVGVEARLEAVGRWLESKLDKSGGGLAKGFVTASLIYCVGAMAIVGSLESGLAANHQTLYAKSILDGIASVILASMLGIGVLFSSVSVLIYQGAITLCAVFVKPMLTETVILQMSAVGGILITAIGINLLEIKKIHVGNMLPAVFIPLLYYGIKMFVGFTG